MEGNMVEITKDSTTISFGEKVSIPIERYDELLADHFFVEMVRRKMKKELKDDRFPSITIYPEEIPGWREGR